ncbi:NAD(+) diphosphatase [Siculibacillus lacustris]|uniref:NAD(+) diphosphatase n=1 Tax=Siculibacillus lacustris TaxID=1549641 RepID=A0A4Q9VYL1_9HYPH|nr:NAD(+) diphosphatase [Siculibacillus lacustris]TBW41224.1 NAD(+) diphosphatase [Siculibacillus lacustris]
MFDTDPRGEPSLAFRFARNALDRRSDLRDDAAAIAARASAPEARFLIVATDRPVLAADPGVDLTAWLTRDRAARLGADFEATIFLGDTPDGPRFAALAAIDEAELAGLPWAETGELRALAVAGRLAADEYGALATARSMLHWHVSHRYCARCGTLSQFASAGWKRTCPSCAAEHFPRTDPVVIMLVVDGERCLLGRSPRFAPGMFSALAGFMEPGETIEAAVRRETFEEAGIRVGRIAYFASEPWPFPASLMIGVFAEATTTAITRDEVELVDCRWFARGEIRAMLAGTHPEGIVAPPGIAIAHHLMRRFAEG